MNIGTHLREARERRGMTLHQLADSTKLSTTALQYIERNEFKRLPGGIFTRSYLRAYAAEVGVNPEEVVREYLVQVLPGAADEPPSLAARGIENPRARRHLLTALVAIVVALVAYRSLRDSPKSPVTSSLEMVQAPVSPPMIEGVASSALSVTERDERGLHLEIQPTGTCWVSAQADGQLVVSRLLQGGEHVTLIARDELVLHVGDPGTFAYTLNGVSGRPLGDAGEPVTVKITEDNQPSQRSLLRSRQSSAAILGAAANIRAIRATMVPTG